MVSMVGRLAKGLYGGQACKRFVWWAGLQKLCMVGRLAKGFTEWRKLRCCVSSCNVGSREVESSEVVRRGMVEPLCGRLSLNVVRDTVCDRKSAACSRVMGMPQQ
jgi:hypothetical protein